MLGSSSQNRVLKNRAVVAGDCWAITSFRNSGDGVKIKRSNHQPDWQFGTSPDQSEKPIQDPRHNKTLQHFGNGHHAKIAASHESCRAPTETWPRRSCPFWCTSKVTLTCGTELDQWPSCWFLWEFPQDGP